MRIFIIHNFYQHPGGEDTVFFQETHELQKRHEVETFSVNNQKGVYGLRQFLLYPFHIFTSFKILNQIKIFKPDVVHIHNLHYALGPWFIRKVKKLGIPVVMTLHNFRLICPSATLFADNKLFTKSISQDFPWTAVQERVLDNSFLKTFLTAFTYWFHKKNGTWKSVDKFFTFSEFSKDIFLQSTLGLGEKKYEIKPNFVSEPKSLTKEFGDYLVYIGRLSSEKGILPLLHAISKTKYTIRIFGNGPQLDEVVRLSELHENIEYHGFQNKETLQEQLRHAAALVVPSICYEGMPMTILEAFALGTPVLTSNIGILKQMVVPLYTGLQFDPYNESNIIESLEEWFQNITPEMKIAMSLNCKQEFNNKYSVQKSLQILEKVYVEVQQNNITQ